MKPQSNNYAKIVETINYDYLQANTVYNAAVSLIDTTRALALAENFQWYRITAIEWEYESEYNVYGQTNQNTSNALPTIPQLYRVMNRNGAFNTTDLQGFINQGAKPFKFTRNVVQKYKPNTLVTTGYTGTADISGTTPFASNYECKYNAWLPCVENSTNEPNQFKIPYYGHSFYFDQDIAEVGDSARVAKLKATVVIEFKNPSSGEVAPHSSVESLTVIKK